MSVHSTGLPPVTAILIEKLLHFQQASLTVILTCPKHRKICAKYLECCHAFCLSIPITFLGHATCIVKIYSSSVNIVDCFKSDFCTTLQFKAKYEANALIPNKTPSIPTFEPSTGVISMNCNYYPFVKLTPTKRKSSSSSMEVVSFFFCFILLKYQSMISAEFS